MQKPQTFILNPNHKDAQIEAIFYDGKNRAACDKFTGFRLTFWPRNIWIVRKNDKIQIVSEKDFKMLYSYPSEIHWNSSDHLPPVDCPLLLLFDNRPVRAIRTGFVANKNNQLEYMKEDGRIIVGRYQWTYP